MQTRALVLTCIGADREGLVEALAEAVNAHGGNWLESRMARLGGRFAGILQVEVPTEREDELLVALGGLETRGLRVMTETARANTPREKPLELEIIGQDRPGIVHEISRVIAANGVNVDELDTACESAPQSGEQLFRARAVLHAPDAVDQEKLFREIEAIALDLMVDVVIETAAD